MTTYDECKNCKKSRKTIISFLFIMAISVSGGIWASVIFWIAGEYFGMPLYDLQRGVKLTTIFGAAVALWWVYWQFDKLICSCDENQRGEIHG
jgi:hypothetical protein